MDSFQFVDTTFGTWCKVNFYNVLWAPKKIYISCLLRAGLQIYLSFQSFNYLLQIIYILIAWPICFWWMQETLLLQLGICQYLLVLLLVLFYIFWHSIFRFTEVHVLSWFIVLLYFSDFPPSNFVSHYYCFPWIFTWNGFFVFSLFQIFFVTCKQQVFGFLKIQTDSLCFKQMTLTW